MPLDAPAQSTISSYFKSSTTTPKKPGKRINSPIDLTSEGEDDAAPSKKPRLEMGSDDTNGRHATSSFADEWRYSPEKDRQYDPNRPRTSAEKQRHEAFKKRLLQDNSHLLQEHREVVDVDQDEPMVVDKSSESDNESEDRFQKLSEMFSNPAKSARAKATSKRPIARSSKGKAVEVGPSGQTYTPLEKQARLQISILCEFLICFHRFFSSREKTKELSSSLKLATSMFFMVMTQR